MNRARKYLNMIYEAEEATTPKSTTETISNDITNNNQYMTTATKSIIKPTQERTNIAPLDKLGRVSGVVNDEIEFALVDKKSILLDSLKLNIQSRVPDLVNRILVYEIGETYPYYAVKYFVADREAIYQMFEKMIIDSKGLMKEVIIYSSSDSELPYAFLDKISDIGADNLLV